MEECLDESQHDESQHRYTDISCMLKAATLLERMPILRRNVENQDIIMRIKQYLYKYCNHVWEEDCIDVSCEKSILIKYCKICNSEYNNK